MLWKRDFIYGLTITIFGVFLLYKTSQIPLLGDVQPIAGARYYLYPWFFLLFILGINLVCQALMQRNRDIKQIKNNPQSDEKGKKESLFPLPTIFTFIVLSLYAFLVKKMGYQISTTLLLFVLFVGFFLFCQEDKFKYIARQKKKMLGKSLKYLGLSLGVVFLIQFIFSKILDVRLP